MREVGERRRRPRAADHLELAGARDRHGARRPAVRLALRLPARRPRDARARARALGARASCAAQGFEPVIPPVLVRERGAVRHRLPARHRAADLPPAARTSCTSSAPARSRSRRCTPARSSTASELPLRYAGFSPCFRREAGAAGKDTRGIFRVHQFDKVEMFSFVDARATRPSEHERLLAIEEEILGELGLPYRVVNIAVDDLGASAAKKYDCEAWLPGQGRYRELTSCSNTTDFQARRLDIRYARRGRPAARGASTRSTGPPWPSAGRSSRCSRTASARTARSRCRSASCAAARRRSSPPAGA